MVRVENLRPVRSGFRPVIIMSLYNNYCNRAYGSERVRGHKADKMCMRTW